MRFVALKSEEQQAVLSLHRMRAQLRLNHRYRTLTGRGLQHIKICVAIAREPAGFIWSIAQQVSPCS